MGGLEIRYKCFDCEMKLYDLNRPLFPSCRKDQNERVIEKSFKRKRKRLPYKTEPEIHNDQKDSDTLIDPEDGNLSIEAEEKKDKYEDGYTPEEADIAEDEDPQEDSDMVDHD